MANTRLKIKGLMLGIGSCSILSLALLSAEAVAIMHLPPELKTPADRKAYTDRLLRQLPWLAQKLASNQAGIVLDTTINNEQLVVSELKVNPEFNQMALTRPELVTLHVGTSVLQEQDVFALKAPAAGAWKEKLLQALSELGTDAGDPPLTSLHKALTTLVDRLADSNLNGLVTGVIRSLPRASHSKFFKIASLSDKVRALWDASELTDEGLRENFNGELYGLKKSEISRKKLLSLIEELQTQEQSLIALLKVESLFYNPQTEKIKSLPSLAKLKAFINALDLTGFSLEVDLRQTLQRFAEKDAKPKQLRTLESQLSLLDPEDDYETTSKYVAIFSPEFTIREVTPYWATFRGLLGVDCSTVRSFDYSYSPMERTFYVYDRAGEAKGYLQGTLVKANNKLTLYIHDLKGAISEDMAAKIVLALRKSLDAFGVEQLSLGTNALQSNGHQAAVINAFTAAQEGGTAVTHVYLDKTLRAYLTTRTGFAPQTYDTPEWNANGILYNPSEADLDRIAVQVRGPQLPGEEAEEVAGSPSENVRETLLRSLDLNMHAFNLEQIGSTMASSDLTSRLMTLLKNPQHLDLSSYYDDVGVELTKFGISISRKFIQDHGPLFWYGHLSASDAFSTEDEVLKKRTIDFLIKFFRQNPHHPLVRDVLRTKKRELARQEKFQSYLESVDGQRNMDEEVLSTLLESGFDASSFTPNQSILILTSQAGPGAVAMAHEILKGNFSNVALPVPLLTRVSHALDNADEAVDETISLAAAQILKDQRFSDAQVIKDLKFTVEDDENIEIAFRAALALVKNGQVDDLTLSTLRDNLKNPDVGAPLIREAREALLPYKHMVVKAPKKCNDALTPSARRA